MKTQAFRRKPLTIKVYNQALTQSYKQLYVCVGQALGLFLLGGITGFYPLLAILLIVELIRLYFAWMQVEAVRDGEVDYLVGGEGEEQ